MELFRFAFENLNHFLGMLVVFGLFFFWLVEMWRIMWRALNVRKHGWPPAGKDADGDEVKD